MKAMSNTVVFKTIPGYPAYRVGSDGSVWSCNEIKPGKGSVRGLKWRRLVGGINDDGYHYHVLCNESKRWTVTTHKLVLMLFVGEPSSSDMEGCHNDGNRGNNSTTNLRWDTGKGNASDRKKHGTLPLGEKNPSSKLTEEQVREIRRRRKAGETNGKLAGDFGVSYATVSGICRRIIWAHLDDLEAA